jgi:hypothetical protein
MLASVEPRDAYWTGLAPRRERWVERGGWLYVQDWVIELERRKVSRTWFCGFLRVFSYATYSSHQV